MRPALAIPVVPVFLAALLCLGAGEVRAGEKTAPVRPSAAEIHGLIIGIDEYRNVPTLGGAVNDARDIAESLRRVGARDVRLLVNGAATREAILAAWKDILAKATPGSTLVLSYAGHGAQSTELVPGSEADGLDEFWVLPDFAPRGPQVHQRLVDDEVGRMLEQASRFNVLFVSDSCHSGTMTRGLDPRGAKPTVRAAKVGAMDPDPLIVPDPHAAAIAMADLGHVTFFGAVPDEEEAPEVAIDGQKRGALSWSFARAITGEADANGDGVITKEEMDRFVRDNVRMKVQGLQHPQVTRGGAADAAALPEPMTRAMAQEAGAASAAAAALDSLTGPARPLPLRLVNLPGGVGAESLLGALTGVAAATEVTPGRFTWDVSQGDVMDGLGEVVGNVGGGDMEAALARLQGVVDKWQTLRRLETVAAGRSLDATLNPGDRRYHGGERTTFQVRGNTQPHFTLINLAADGTVNFLYPLRTAAIKDAGTIPLGGPYTLSLKVTPPFGADHFVAIASDRDLGSLHRELRALDGQPEAAQIPALLARHLQGVKFELGLHGVYSGS